MRRCFSYDVTKTALQNTVPINRNAAEDYDLKKTYPIISLDAFYENLTSFTLTDAEAMQYMTFAAKMARIRFESDAEMLSLKADFQCALAFIGKLEEVDVKGQEPLGNVLEYYGGNSHKMRSASELDQITQENYKSKFLDVNKHARRNGTYAVYPMTSIPNADGE